MADPQRRHELRARPTRARSRPSRSAARTRRVVMVAFPDAQVLDVTGPLEVFASANTCLPEAARAGEAGYRVELAASRAGALRTSSGLRLVADRPLRDVRGAIDTLIVAGGEGTRDAVGDAGLLRELRRTAARARRVASVCTGAFLLAEAGLLAGRRATSHWASTRLLAARHPDVSVEPDRIFTRDGDVWTSAGVTAGMDLALALVEEDVGREVALAVARKLVLFTRRPGGQSQFSALLAAQWAERDPLRDLQGFILEHPEADLSVPALSRRAGMSPRNFARAFAREVGTTPARFVEQARLEAARRHLEASRLSVEAIAAACGFGSAETMRRAFLRGVRVGPTAYRSRFQSPGAEAGEARRAGGAGGEARARRGEGRGGGSRRARRHSRDSSRTGRRRTAS